VYILRQSMTVFDIFGYYLWIAPKLLLIILLWGMVYRGLHRQFPMFFSYAALQVIQSGILLAISRHFGFHEQYHRAYSVTIAMSASARFCVIHELFSHFFHEYPLLVGPGRVVLRGATIALLLVAVGLAVLAPGNSADFLLNATYALDRTVSVLQCGLMISLFVFSRYFALSWRSPAVGIALGLGILASVALATSTIRLHLGVFGNHALNFFTMATYHCCVLIWMFYLMAPARERRHTSMTLPQSDLHIWNQELERLLQR
jgi:hypothetical protein